MTEENKEDDWIPW